MLYSAAGATILQRIQGAFTNENEVKRVVKFLVDEKIAKGIDEIGEDLGGGGSAPLDLDSPTGGETGNDEMYERAKRVTIETQNPSTTHLQMMLEIGYPRAARLTQLLLKNGIIGNNDAGKRAVLVKSLEEGKQYGDDPLSDQAAREKWQM
jgi:S-DNA-T family DNA segregation ATPase FtsK/SpoIIIE